MSRSLVLGSDIGSGSCKTLLAEQGGSVVARADAPYELRYPRPGWAEYDPEDWYAAFRTSVRDVIAQVEGAADRIDAICIVGITHDPVLLDDANQPVRPAIHFNDQRTTAQCADLTERFGAAALERAINAVGTYWTWPQLQWIRDHEPEVWRRIRTMVFPKDWVRWRVTGGDPGLTDEIDAGGTLLFDPRGRSWIEAFVNDLGLSHEVLPRIADPFDQVGEVGARAAAETGLRVGTPVLAGTTDTAAEMLGIGGLEPGDGMLKLASVGRIAMVAPAPVPHEHVLNYRHLLPDRWYPGTATKYAAQAYRWLADALWPDVEPNDYVRMDAAAASVPPGSGGMLFLPHLLGQSAPLWNPRLKGAFLGLGFEHHRDHVTRAVLEGVAYAMRDALDALFDLGLDAERFQLVGNGARSPLWRQIVTDVVQRPLTIPAERDAAYGAVLMAEIATGGLSRRADAIRARVHVEAEVVPDAARMATYERLFELYREANRSLEHVSGELYDLQLDDEQTST